MDDVANVERTAAASEHIAMQRCRIAGIGA
jgi:hypothetical protein